MTKLKVGDEVRILKKIDERHTIEVGKVYKIRYNRAGNIELNNGFILDGYDRYVAGEHYEVMHKKPEVTLPWGYQIASAKGLLQLPCFVDSLTEADAVAAALKAGTVGDSFRTFQYSIANTYKVTTTAVEATKPFLPLPASVRPTCKG